MCHSSSCILGPGLLESTYQQCLAYELNLNGIDFRREYQLPVDYKGLKFDCSYRLDLLIENEVIFEFKSIDELHPIREAQLLT
jgi:GxxExxY protein